VALPALALVVVFLSAGLVALLVWNVASVNAGERDGSSLLVRTNLAVGGSALLAVLLLVLVLVTAVGAPRGASPVIVKLAALAAFALCGLLAVAGAWVVYSNVESYVATAVTGSSPDALPPPVGADLAEPPPAPAPPPPPPASLRSVRPSGGRSPAEGRSSGGTAAIRVGGEIKEPRKIRNVPPVYPQIAKEARVQGVVILEATIGREGNVTDVKVLRAIPLLDQAAIDAVRQWVYAPTLLNGEPVPVIMTVTVNFKLSSQ
jgi:protein TonB